MGIGLKGVFKVHHVYKLLIRKNALKRSISDKSTIFVT